MGQFFLCFVFFFFILSHFALISFLLFRLVVHSLYLVRKCALGECVRSEQSRARAKAVALWRGRGWLSVWEWKVACGGWFAFIRTWGERGGALCECWVKNIMRWFVFYKINHSAFLFVRFVICCGWKWVWGENGCKRAVGGSVRASGGRACLSVRRRGERPFNHP